MCRTEIIIRGVEGRTISVETAYVGAVYLRVESSKNLRELS